MMNSFPQLFLISWVLIFSIGCNAQSNKKQLVQEESNFEKADYELNEVYQLILSDYADNQTFISSLKESQRLWIRFRDTELEMRYPGDDKRLQYGSVYSMCAEQFLAQLTNKRTATLRQWIDGVQEGDVCAGSIKIK